MTKKKQKTTRKRDGATVEKLRRGSEILLRGQQVSIKFFTRGRVTMPED